MRVKEYYSYATGNLPSYLIIFRVLLTFRIEVVKSYAYTITASKY